MPELSQLNGGRKGGSSAWVTLGALSLASGELRLGDRSFSPCPTLAWFEFECSFSYPVVTAYQMALHPAVIAASFDTFEGQMVNLGHLVKSYNRDSIVRDRIIGHVEAVEFPPPPQKFPGGGGAARWTLPAPGAQPPRIRGVAALFKAAEGVDRILGSHQADRKPWTVSMEIRYLAEDGGFLVPEAAASALSGTVATEDLRAHGVVYVPWSAAPKDLRACFTPAQVVKPWKKAPVTYLHGGLDGQVHYAGLGIVNNGAEPAARIRQVTAGSLAAPDFKPVIASLHKLCATLKKD